ncbi:DUF2785 domain-containing protein [Candidatus Bipolaricaulota bacterium]
MNNECIKAIIDDEYQIPSGANLDDLTSQLTANLGSTDAYARENSLEVLWQWGQSGQFDDVQLLRIGQAMADNLSVGLGESETDTVFLRSFSALVLAMVLLVDQRFDFGQIEGRSPFLSKEMVLDWCECALSCLEREQDYRGSVAGSGWAHAIAHLADVLSDFAPSKHLGAEHLERLLHVIAGKLGESTACVLQFDEDNRLVQTIMSVLRREELSLPTLQEWLQRLSQTPDGGHWGDVYGLEACDERANNARLNTRSFLRSLYFQLLIGSRSFRAKIVPQYYALPILHREELMAGIVDVLKAMDKWFYPKEE